MQISLNSLVPFSGNLYYDYKNKNFIEKNEKQDVFEMQTKEQQNIDSDIIEKIVRNAFASVINMIYVPLDMQTQGVHHIKRSDLSKNQLHQMIQESFDKAFDELNVPKEMRPELVIQNNEKSLLDHGAYKGHKLFFNEASYKECVLLDIDKTIMHEATHCLEALKRAGLPQDRVNNIVKNEIYNIVKNGEPLKNYKMVNGKLVYDTADIRIDLPDKMKEDLLQMLEAIFEAISKNEDISFGNDFIKHPEFLSNYKNESEAAKALSDYLRVIIVFYKCLTNIDIIDKNGNKIQFEELKGKELDDAEQSLKNYIITYKSIINKVNCDKKYGIAANELHKEYMLSPEEVLAEINGCEFAIKNAKEKLEKNNLSEKEIEFINQKIQFHKNDIEHRKLGAEYIKLYKEIYNGNSNPEILSKWAEIKNKFENTDKKQDAEILDIMFELCEHQYL